MSWLLCINVLTCLITATGQTSFLCTSLVVEILTPLTVGASGVIPTVQTVAALTGLLIQPFIEVATV